MFNSSLCCCFNAEHLFGGIALFCLPSLSLPFKIPFPLGGGLLSASGTFLCFEECLGPPSVGTHLVLCHSGQAAHALGKVLLLGSPFPDAACCPGHASCPLAPYPSAENLAPINPPTWRSLRTHITEGASILRDPETAWSGSGKGVSLRVSTLYH